MKHNTAHNDYMLLLNFIEAIETERQLALLLVSFVWCVNQLSNPINEHTHLRLYV